jgi:hypothetical protein
MGHSDIRMTLSHYAKVLPAADARALEALDAFEIAALDRGGRISDAHANG